MSDGIETQKFCVSTICKKFFDSAQNDGKNKRLIEDVEDSLKKGERGLRSWKHHVPADMSSAGH